MRTCIDRTLQPLFTKIHLYLGVNCILYMATPKAVRGSRVQSIKPCAARFCQLSQRKSVITLPSPTHSFWSMWQYFSRPECQCQRIYPVSACNAVLTGLRVGFDGSAFKNETAFLYPPCIDTNKWLFVPMNVQISSPFKNTTIGNTKILAVRKPAC